MWDYFLYMTMIIYVCFDFGLLLGDVMDELLPDEICSMRCSLSLAYSGTILHSIIHFHQLYCMSISLSNDYIIG